MQIIGIFTAVGVIVIGFMERETSKISAFDWHALVIILMGSFGAVLLGSGVKDFLRTIIHLRELIPGLKLVTKETKNLDQQRQQIEKLWLEGNRTDAIRVAETNNSKVVKETIKLLLEKSRKETVDKKFTDIDHEFIDLLQPSANNWELMSRLGPSFGIIGTITGMVTLFKNFGSGANLGSSMSLALLATLYGISFGAGIAGPIGHYLSKILDERLDVHQRYEKTIKYLNNL